MNKVSKILTRITSASAVSLAMVGTALAATPPPEIEPSGTIKKSFNLADFFSNTVETIINIVFFLAAAAAIIYLIWAGVKYITAGGDTKKAGEARQAILNAVIGIAVVIGAYTLINIAFGINSQVEELETSPETFR